MSKSAHGRTIPKFVQWVGLLIILGFITALIGAKGILYYRAKLPTTPQTALPNPNLIEEGAYLSRLSDCAACHTQPGGEPYAGGLAMQTPIGAIYSTNITPDPNSGIGRYSLAQFSAAVQYGVRNDGTPLYPAMPYPSYVLLSDHEMEALYAYFMLAVEPAAVSNEVSTIPPILNWRWPLAWWQLLFAPDRQFIPHPEKSEDYNRGAYLVEGPGHCGACHTPRGIAYQELAMRDDSSNRFLSGAVIDGWRAKSLRGEARGLQQWSEAEIALFLKTGRTDTIAAFGAMTDVVEQSTQYFSDEDLASIAHYLKTLSPAPNKAETLPDKEDQTTDYLLSGNYLHDDGALLYMEHCATCHRPDGQGAPRIIPALTNNSAVTAARGDSVIQITLEGGSMPHTPADMMAFTMPKFNHLSNEEIADLLNFVRNSWHNQAPIITPQEVNKIRHFLKTKSPNRPLTQGDHDE